MTKTPDLSEASRRSVLRTVSLFGGVTLLSQTLQDPVVHPLLLAVDALGVDLEQHVDRVAGACRHFRCGHTGVEPLGHACVPQVVRPEGEHRRDLFGQERQLSRLLPHARDTTRPLRRCPAHWRRASRPWRCRTPSDAHGAGAPAEAEWARCAPHPPHAASGPAGRAPPRSPSTPYPPSDASRPARYVPNPTPRVRGRLTSVQLAAQRLQHIARQYQITQVHQGTGRPRHPLQHQPVLRRHLPRPGPARPRRTSNAAEHGAAAAHSAAPEGPTASSA